MKSWKIIKRRKEAIKSFSLSWPSIILAFCVVFNFASFRVGYTHAAWTATAEMPGNSVTTGVWGVVLNEILPNPEGDDTQIGALGEWVEFYNNGNLPVELANYYVKNAEDDKITIASTNTWNNETEIPSHGWVVLFMDGDILNNEGDIVGFYNPSNILIDEYSFTPASGDDNEGKSYARIPDGVGNWVDPVPTLGAPNRLEEISGESVPEAVTGGGKESILAPELEAFEETEELTSEAEFSGQQSLDEGSSETDDEEINVIDSEEEIVGGDQTSPNDGVGLPNDEISDETSLSEGEENLSTDKINSSEEASDADINTVNTNEQIGSVDDGTSSDVKTEDPAPIIELQPTPESPVPPTPEPTPTTSDGGATE
ncbi:MAG: lamin tail domain-containing protein [Parcubacteria group bacterium]